MGEDQVDLGDKTEGDSNYPGLLRHKIPTRVVRATELQEEVVTSLPEREAGHTSLYDEVYGEVLDRRREKEVVKRSGRRLESKRLELPNIIIDHSSEDWSHYDSLLGRGSGEEREKKVNRRDIPDIVSHVRRVPVIILNTEPVTSDEEMEDYYENHKDWPAGVR